MKEFHRRKIAFRFDHPLLIKGIHFPVLPHLNNQLVSRRGSKITGCVLTVYQVGETVGWQESADVLLLGCEERAHDCVLAAKSSSILLVVARSAFSTPDSFCSQVCETARDYGRVT